MFVYVRMYVIHYIRMYLCTGQAVGSGAVQVDWSSAEGYAGKEPQTCSGTMYRTYMYVHCIRTYSV